MNIVEYMQQHIGSNVAFVFGLFLLFGVLGGILAGRVSWMPTITAFMLLGFIIGPGGLSLISKQTLAESIIFIDIALGLILYKLGNMIHPKAMLKSRRLVGMALAESVLSYVAVFAGGVLLGLETVTAALIAAISVSSSPAVLVHVSEELRAKGPVSDRAKSLVAINNLLAFVLFSAALPFGMQGDDYSLPMLVGVPVYRLLGAVGVGIATAWLMVRIARMLRAEDAHYRFAVVIGGVMCALGLCEMLGFSGLFAPLVLGIATRWFESAKNNLSKIHLGEGGDLFFIVLFVMAGAKINIPALIAIGAIPLVLVLLRSFAKIAGLHAAGVASGVSARQSFATSLMLLPMAGMAIGLVTTSSALAADVAGPLAAIVFAMVVMLETAGPFLVTYGLRLAGETGLRAEEEMSDTDEKNL